MIRQATLTFNGKPFKEVQPGGTFEVVASRPAEKRVYLKVKDATGKEIALAADEDAVELVQGHVKGVTEAPDSVANSNVADQRMDASKVAAEVARLRKNANAIDRPNPLLPNDTSNQKRAAKMRAQADTLERKGRLP